jgi:branched-chain amino acid transport system substrate-binding protein
MVSASNTNAGLTKGSSAERLRVAQPDANNYFRVCGTDDLQGPAGAQLIEQFNLKTVYIVDNSDTYGKSLADLFEVSFISAGGKVLGHDETTLAQRDYTTVVTHIKNAHPDAVYFGSTGVELGTLRKQMAEAGIGDIPYFGGDAMNEEVFPKIAGPAAHNSYFTVMTPNGLQLTTPQAKHFTKAFEHTYHSEPLPYDAGSYAAGQVEVAAIREALETNDTHRPTREQVRANIAATHDMPSAIGSITFNRVGDIRDPYVSYYTFNETSKKMFLKQFVYHTE